MYRIVNMESIFYRVTSEEAIGEKENYLKILAQQQAIKVLEITMYFQ